MTQELPLISFSSYQRPALNPNLNTTFFPLKYSIRTYITLYLGLRNRIVYSVCHYSRDSYNMSDSQASSSIDTKTSAPSSSTAPAPSDVDIEKLLSREATAFQRELEVERILKAFKLK